MRNIHLLMGLFGALVALVINAQIVGTTTARDPGVRGGPPGFNGCMSGLTVAEKAACEEGKVKFEEEEDVATGLGPLYNSVSCQSCHSHPATGETSPALNPLIRVATIAWASNPIPPFEKVNGPALEVREKCIGPTSNRCGVVAVYTITDRSDAPGCRVDLGALYRRLIVRRGKKRTIVAVAHTMLLIAYQVLKHGCPYKDLGVDYFDRLDARGLQKRWVKKLTSLGFEVTLTPASEPAI